MPKLAFAVVVAVIAVSKVRLVVLDFMGERQDRSPIRRALIAWAAAVLAIALIRAAIVGMAVT
ncbi:quinol-cytochrome oxidoreductase complex cytochrome b subunit [Rhizobium leguminosarum]|nr:quinol-cytochrome oxidoreductase complex cytochrome b subunit [Rhizobium leguminosarum]